MQHHIDIGTAGGFGASLVTLAGWMANSAVWVEAHYQLLGFCISVIMTILTGCYWRALLKIKASAERREQRESDARIAAMEGGRRQNDQ